VLLSYHIAASQAEHLDQEVPSVCAYTLGRTSFTNDAAYFDLDLAISHDLEPLIAASTKDCIGERLGDELNVEALGIRLQLALSFPNIEAVRFSRSTDHS
jgi:hypothetical protein